MVTITSAWATPSQSGNIYFRPFKQSGRIWQWTGMVAFPALSKTWGSCWAVLNMLHRIYNGPTRIIQEIRPPTPTPQVQNYSGSGGLPNMFQRDPFNLETISIRQLHLLSIGIELKLSICVIFLPPISALEVSRHNDLLVNCQLWWPFSFMSSSIHSYRFISTQLVHTRRC